MGRGRYGQIQGDERRAVGAAVVEHYADNHVAEGDDIAVLRRILSSGDLQGAANFMETLRRKGHSDYRIAMMYGQASAGLRI